MHSLLVNNSTTKIMLMSKHIFNNIYLICIAKIFSFNPQLNSSKYHSKKLIVISNAVPIILCIFILSPYSFEKDYLISKL